jgi:hypothetical protein
MLVVAALHCSNHQTSLPELLSNYTDPYSIFDPSQPTNLPGLELLPPFSTSASFFKNTTAEKR